MNHRKVYAIVLLLASLVNLPVALGGEGFETGVKGASATKLHLEPRQAHLHDTGFVIRGFSVSDPEIAEATAVGPRQLKITGKTKGTAILVYWTEAGVPSSIDLFVSVGNMPGKDAAKVVPPGMPEKIASYEEGAVAGPTDSGTGLRYPSDITGAGSAERASMPKPAAPGNAAEVSGNPYRVALFPVENLSGRPAPLVELRKMLAEGLMGRGFSVLPESDLQGIMARHRIRYTGGITRKHAQAILGETGTKAVLLVSLEYYSDGPPPKVSFVARLVSTGEQATILWMRSVGMSGDDHPGFLGRGLVWAPEEILRKAVATALDSLAKSVPSGMARMAVRDVSNDRYRPKRYFRAPELDLLGSRPVTVAVVPFLNIGNRQHAGSLMGLHFVDRLAQAENVQVIEPGVVREELLLQRVIMEGGPSVPQTGLLFSMLEVDLILTGTVAEYIDSGGTGGESRVDFTVVVFDGKTRRVVWSSRSYNRGDDGVFFFELGTLRTAAELASSMAHAVVERVRKGDPPGGAAEGPSPYLNGATLPLKDEEADPRRSRIPG